MQTIARPLSIIIIGQAVIGWSIVLFVMAFRLIFYPAELAPVESNFGLHRDDGLPPSLESASFLLIVVCFFYFFTGWALLQKRPLARPILIALFVMTLGIHYFYIPSSLPIIALAGPFVLASIFLYLGSAQQFLLSPLPIAPSELSLIRNGCRVLLASSTCGCLIFLLLFSMMESHRPQLRLNMIIALFLLVPALVFLLAFLAPKKRRLRDAGLGLLLPLGLASSFVLYGYLNIIGYHDDPRSGPLSDLEFYYGNATFGITVIIIIALLGSAFLGIHYSCAQPVGPLPSTTSGDPRSKTDDSRKSPYAPPLID